ncbi:MAG: enoyl-CoA hydratase/isomerase family protein [Hyphomicrobiales bacterium]
MSVDLEITDHIALIRINRPERMNALDPDHYTQLSEAFIAARDDERVRVSIVTGAGEKAFCAGGDLKAPMPRLDELSELPFSQKDMMPHRGLEIWKPIVAAVNGYCLGGGLCLLLATDIRVSAEHATFGFSEIKRGGVPGNGGTQRIVRQLPYPIAMEMLLTGDPIDAARAASFGLVNRVVPAVELMDAAMDYARKIAKGPPLAMQMAKELGLRGQEMDLASGMRLERMMQALLHTSDDWREGGAAFAEKRPPRFTGN